jgi:hypothetical protein
MTLAHKGVSLGVLTPLSHASINADIDDGYFEIHGGRLFYLLSIEF